MMTKLGAAVAAVALACAGSAGAAIVYEGVETGDYAGGDFRIGTLGQPNPPLRITYDADVSLFEALYVTVEVWTLLRVFTPEGIHYDRYESYYTPPITFTPTGFSFVFDADENAACDPATDYFCLHSYFTRFTVEGPIAGDIPYRVTISPVPESSTWAMMIAGFLCSGVMLRRSRTPQYLQARA